MVRTEIIDHKKHALTSNSLIFYFFFCFNLAFFICSFILTIHFLIHCSWFFRLVFVGSDDIYPLMVIDQIRFYFYIFFCIDAQIRFYQLGVFCAQNVCLCFISFFKLPSPHIECLRSVI